MPIQHISETDPTPTNIYWGRVGGGTKKHLRGTIPSAKSIVFKKANIFFITSKYFSYFIF